MARICMVAYTHYRTDSRVRREAEALAGRGDRVDFICLDDGNGKQDEILNGVHLIKMPVSRYRGSNAGAYMASYFQFFFRVMIRLAGLHIRQPYDVVQVHTMPDFMVFTAIVPKLRGARIILDVHDLVPELYQSKFGYTDRHILIRFITFVERLSIWFADRTIAVHQPHLEALCRHGNPASKFIILLNLPDKKIFHRDDSSRPSNNSEFELIYHGTISERHGLEIAVRAISELRGKLDGLTMKIIGDGDDMPRLTNLVEELGLNSCIHIMRGMVPMEQLVGEIEDASIGVVPLLDDEFTRYMLPVKLLEYVALNIPVICSRTVTIQAYFDESMVQFTPAGNVSALAANIEFLYNNPGRMEELRANASRFNFEYSWEKQKQTYFELIDRLLQS